jgi:hypothetical protein
MEVGDVYTMAVSDESPITGPPIECGDKVRILAPSSDDGMYLVETVDPKPDSGDGETSQGMVCSTTRIVPEDTEEVRQRILELVQPNPHTLTSEDAFCGLLGLVVEEPILHEYIRDLTMDERREIATWASRQHVAAAQEDPPWKALPMPEVTKKVLLHVGRRVLIAQGRGEIVPWEGGMPTGLPKGQPIVAVRLSNGDTVCVPPMGIIGVFE